MFARTLSSLTALVPPKIKYRLSSLHAIYNRILRMGGKTSPVTTLYGQQFSLELDDLTSQEHVLGTYERLMQAAFEQYVTPGMTVCDIGAFNGFHSLLLAAKGATVVAFEPDPKNRDSLIRQTQNNPLLAGAITVMPYALSDTSGHQRITSSGFMSRLSTTGVSVETRTLDSFDLHPDLIKIDVEGHELPALQGGIETIRKYRPIILCDYDTPETRPQLVKLLGPLDYELLPEEIPIVCLP